MHRSLRTFLLLALTLGLSSSAHAALLTLGSGLDLDAASSINENSERIQQQGADTAFWPIRISNGSAVQVPEDGQIVKVTLKGTVFKEDGASPPANLIHFQSLEPAAADGSRKVWLTSGAFYLPIDQPNAISSYRPENLCIHQGGTWTFNDVGGHTFAGSYEPGGPTDQHHYIGGARFALFGLSDAATTVQYTAADQTKNGYTLYPSTTNQQIDFPYGNTKDGVELLMQVVVATGMDRSEACGGPRRHPDGSLVQVGPDPMYMKVVTDRGKAQRPYVTKDRKFQVGVYCGGEEIPACTGKATILIGKRVLDDADFTIPQMKSGRISMRLSPKDFRTLDSSKSRTLKTTFVLQTSFGTSKSSLTLKR